MNIRRIKLRRNFQIGVGGPYYQVEIEAEPEGVETMQSVVSQLKAKLDQQIAPLFPVSPGWDGSYGFDQSTPINKG